MKKKNVWLGVAAGIVLLSGCMSPEEIKQEKEKAEARKIVEAQKRKEEKEKAEAIKFTETKKRADAGDSKMAFHTGYMLKNGIGVKPDLKLAFVYYKKAFQTGNISAAWHMMKLIYDTGDTGHSQLFGECYQLLWTRIWSQEIWPTIRRRDQRVTTDNKKRRVDYKRSFAICQGYLKKLQLNGKDTEADLLAKRLIATIEKKPTNSFPDTVYFPQVKGDIANFKDNLMKIQVESEQKRIAEQKRMVKSKLEKKEGIKYFSKDFAHGVKLYKHLSSGISLEWFILETLSKDGQIKCLGKGNYFLILSSTAYPGVTFKFSSNKKDSEMTENINWSNYNQMNLSDPQGVLFEVEISLPGNIDSKKIYQKYCNEYPQIKPVLKPNNYEKPIPVPPQAYGYRMKFKGKRGQYLWKNDKVLISFFFLDKPEIIVSGPDPDKVEILRRTLEEQQSEMRSMCIRKVLIRDEKLYHRFVASKIEKAKNAIKAKEEAAQKAALDF